MERNKVPGSVVAAFAMTHTPGLGNGLPVAPKEQVERLMAGFAEARRILDAARPDLVIALVNDHFDMFGLDNMPTFTIAIADEHWGPPAGAEAWLQLKRDRIPGNANYARDIYREAVRSGFDLSRCGPAELVHNVLMPLKYLRPERDLPIVPIFTNCLAPPLPTMARCYSLGELIGRVIGRRSERIALIASGGISHWPPFAKEDGPKGDELNRRMLEVQRKGPGGRELDPGVRDLILKREADMAASGRNLINEAWDRKMLAAFERGDKQQLLEMTYEDIERDGGNGGHEMAMWVMMMGALGGAPSRTIVYEPIKEWMGGVGLISYDERLSS
ncbi:2,3-dihydroxyphenylpropionate 1,2-dioxygenase [Bradyrhizobium sp. i1.8.4]|uniref:DODA-type extradiol aromatic ring-opening family dioxygenase n=1 Tax=unclassified Bradyrhizobium TaxID=2631580 RepID=UPI003D1E146B